MRNSICRFKPWSTLQIAVLLAFVTCFSSSRVMAQPMDTVHFELQDVWLLPDISHPRDSAQPMSGSFDWTYQIGDFENGSAQFTDLTIPWYNPGINELNINVELKSIEFTLPGNFHDRGIDITLFLQDPLSPGQASPIDLVRSKFEIQLGVSYQGHVISGAIAPVSDLDLTISGVCPSALQFRVNKATPNGRVAILYSPNTGSFVIPNRFPCAGTVLGLSNKVVVGRILTADANGTVVFDAPVPAQACGNISVQALDMNGCGTSGVVVLQ